MPLLLALGFQSPGESTQLRTLLPASLNRLKLSVRMPESWRCPGSQVQVPSRARLIKSPRALAWSLRAPEEVCHRPLSWSSAGKAWLQFWMRVQVMLCKLLFPVSSCLSRRRRLSMAESVATLTEPVGRRGRNRILCGKLLDLWYREANTCGRDCGPQLHQDALGPHD